MSAHLFSIYTNVSLYDRVVSFSSTTGAKANNRSKMNSRINNFAVN